MKRRRVFREWQHPRDDRGRFSRSGGGSWAKRAAGAFAKAEEGRVTPPAVAGRPRIGRNAKAGLILNQHQPGAGDTLSRKWTPPEKLPPNASRLSISQTQDLSMKGRGAQVLHDGKWLEVSGHGFRNDAYYIRLRPKDGGDTIEITDTGQTLIARPHQLEFKEPLDPHQARLMAAWQADAARPATGFRVPTRREDSIARHAKEVAEKEAALKEAKRKARARVRKKYPSSEGYDKWTWDYEVDNDDKVRQAERDLHFPRIWLEHARQPDSNPDTEAYLNGPGLGMATFEGELNRDRPLAVYGDMLHIEDEDQATFRHLRDLSLLPAEVHAIVARSMATQRANRADSKVAGLRDLVGIFLGSRPVHELNHSQDLAAERPRGWGEDDTFSEVDGVYRGTGTLIVGATSQSQGRGEHGQPALHEFGHALDHAVGRIVSDSGNWASADPEWRALHRQTVAAAPDISPYFKQDGDAGPQEMWAEAFGEWSRARAKARMSSAYIDAPDGGRVLLVSRGEMALRREFRIPADRHDVAAALNSYFEALVAKLGVDL